MGAGVVVQVRRQNVSIWNNHPVCAALVDDALPSDRASTPMFLDGCARGLALASARVQEGHFVSAYLLVISG